MHNQKIIKSGFLTAILMISLASMIPRTFSWVYQDSTPEDTKYEKFGPRADRLLTKLYQDADSMWQALADGYIDTTDTSLTQPWYNIFTNPPYNDTIKVVGYGPELNFYMLDVNNANATSSPVYPNPCNVLSFRQALAHLVDRAWFNIIIGAANYVPIWVPMSPAMGKYYLNIPNPYPYSIVSARNLLDADGFPVNTGTGWRYWDRNGNQVEDPGEYLELKFVISSDHNHRRQIGDLIANELNGVNIRVNRIYATRQQAYIIVMVNRDFHLYTGAYSVAEPIPTYLYTCFHSSMIPSSNHNSINDTSLDYWLEELISAPTQQDAVTASHNAQRVFVQESFKVPLWVYVNHKAMYRRYTGGTAGNLVIPDDGENQYRNKYWQGTVNTAGQGIDNFWSFPNMHPTGYAYGHNGNMTLRHGFSRPNLGYLNPIYASTLPDLQVMDLIYDKLMRRDPYNITEWMPWIAKNFTVGTYFHPVYLENYTKVTVTLRTDVTWHDGTPLTTADVYFTLKELKRSLEAHGFPPPWWIANVEHILDFKIFDPYNFEILFDIKGYWALSWIGDTPILPKHVWKSIVEMGNPTGFAPDPNLIGSGPWRLTEYVGESHILMVANKASRTVQTNLAGSEPIHSPHGYFQFYPVYTDVHFKPPYEYRHKIPPLTLAELKVTLENLIQETVVVENISAVDLSNPVSSQWNKTWPLTLWSFFLTSWIDDDHNGLLSPSDFIGMVWEDSAQVEWYVVETMLFGLPGAIVMRLNPIVIVNKCLYVDEVSTGDPVQISLKPKTPDEEQLIFFGFAAARHRFKAATHIKEPNWDSWKLNCTWINYTLTFWATIREDIVGSTLYDDIGLPTYPYKSQLASPDIKVDIKDIAVVAKAFGSYPGHPRWSPYADITCEYKIDIKDIALVAKRYGWHG